VNYLKASWWVSGLKVSASKRGLICLEKGWPLFVLGLVPYST
jgi:hypothetical protein